MKRAKNIDGTTNVLIKNKTGKADRETEHREMRFLISMTFLSG